MHSTIKKQQEKAKKQVEKGEKDLIPKVKLPDIGKLELAKEKVKKSKEKQFKVVGAATEFVRAFTMGKAPGKAMARDYSIKSADFARNGEKGAMDGKAFTRAVTGDTGEMRGGRVTQTNTFNFYDVGSKTLDELMDEFVPKFKLVCQNI